MCQGMFELQIRGKPRVPGGPLSCQVFAFVTLSWLLCAGSEVPAYLSQNCSPWKYVLFHECSSEEMTALGCRINGRGA
jgi:hypothetical protein